MVKSSSFNVLSSQSNTRDIEIISYAGKIREVVETFRATHTPHHATTIRASAEYLMYFARYNNQEARRQIDVLEREASVY